MKEHTYPVYVLTRETFHKCAEAIRLQTGDWMRGSKGNFDLINYQTNILVRVSRNPPQFQCSSLCKNCLRKALPRIQWFGQTSGNTMAWTMGERKGFWWNKLGKEQIRVWKIFGGIIVFGAVGKV